MVLFGLSLEVVDHLFLRQQSNQYIAMKEDGILEARTVTYDRVCSTNSERSKKNQWKAHKNAEKIRINLQLLIYRLKISYLVCVRVSYKVLRDDHIVKEYSLFIWNLIHMYIYMRREFLKWPTFFNHFEIYISICNTFDKWNLLTIINF